MPGGNHETIDWASPPSQQAKPIHGAMIHHHPGSSTCYSTSVAALLQTSSGGSRRCFQEPIYGATRQASRLLWGAVHARLRSNRPKPAVLFAIVSWPRAS